MKILTGLVFLCILPAFLCAKRPSCDDTNSAPASKRLQNGNANTRLGHFSTTPTTTTTRHIEADGTAAFRDLPEELVSQILECLDVRTLMTSRQVCTGWKERIDSETLRKKIGLVNGRVVPNAMSPEEYLKIYYILEFEKNIWQIHYQQSGARFYPVKPKIITPRKIYQLESRNSPPFSATIDTPHQNVVDLVQVGLPAGFLDMQPTIEIREWYYCRFGDPPTITGSITLLDANNVQLHVETINVRLAAEMKLKWFEDTTRLLKNYGQGLRRIEFNYNLGVDHTSVGHGLYIRRR